MIVGGKSSEHEISLKSGKSVSDMFNSTFYEVLYFYIDKSGYWSIHNEFPSVSTIDKPKTQLISHEVLDSLMECQIMFPVLHGTFGEDGTIQGLFEILDKPYIGCDYRSSAIAMDKALTKLICASCGILTSPYISFTENEWRLNSNDIYNDILEKLNFPLYVKPSHLGSAIGVNKVEDVSLLKKVILEVLTFDDKIVVEEEIIGREIEFAVIGNQKVTVFPPGEVLAEGKLYSYDAKYGEGGFNTSSKAQISDNQLKYGKDLALKVYTILGCQGLARVDFFLDMQGQFWLNEVNPIPGFTSISLYPKICEENGLCFDKILDKLIILASHRHRSKGKYL